MVFRTMITAGFISISVCAPCCAATLVAGSADSVIARNAQVIWPNDHTFSSPDMAHGDRFAVDVPSHALHQNVAVVRPLDFTSSEARKTAMIGYLSMPRREPVVQEATDELLLVELPLPMASMLLMSAFGMLGLVTRRGRAGARADRPVYARLWKNI